MQIDNIRIRSNVVKLIRRFFDERGYTEMHTPRLVGLPGQEPYLEPFWTEVQVARQQTTDNRQQITDNRQQNGICYPSSDICHLPAALITSPEYAMKRLLAEGMDTIYDLGSCFRNAEPFDGTHDPEFLMLEWYRKDADLSSLMDETEEMIRWVSSELCHSRENGNPGNIQNTPIDHSGLDSFRQLADRRNDGLLGTTFRRLTVESAFREYLGIELSPLIGDREAMAAVCHAHHQTVTEGDTWDDLYFKLFLSEIEPKIAADQPTFLYRYPASQAALATRCVDDPRYADRVELYVGGLELSNGFAELADADEQRKRFEEEQALRRSLGKKVWPIDEQFLTALPKMGTAIGNAFGVDRFVMLLTGATSINEVIPFPARERFRR